MGGVKVYETALKCVINEDLKEEWEKYHQETERHVQILHDVCAQLQIDPDKQTPGRKIVHDMGQSLVKAMEAALASGDKEQAQCTACDCVVLAETKDHANWEADRRGVQEGDRRRRQGAEGGLCRGRGPGGRAPLPLEGLDARARTRDAGLKAVLPPPEERKQVKTASARRARSRARPKCGETQKSPPDASGGLSSSSSEKDYFSAASTARFAITVIRWARYSGEACRSLFSRRASP
jgi:hypothetical protein